VRPFSLRAAASEEHHRAMLGAMKKLALSAFLLVGCAPADEMPQQSPPAPSVEGEPPPAPPTREEPKPPAPPPVSAVRSLSCHFDMNTSRSVVTNGPIGYYMLAVAQDGTAAATAQVNYGGPNYAGDLSSVKPTDERYPTMPVIVTAPDGDWLMSADRSKMPVALRVQHAGMTFMAGCEAR
jgi:hypothetical protein